ncbi:BTAD domain-containing putative transcriptional regulator [Streptomyces sp. XD-27]|uniref:AfsR/SARP family transcriptional regulator n=1 Tax=Streptomyces sp. XD-27 TaxID=3062779 RepID=UPI0026F473BE|nr:BTAD domain-containing putative transcriptional regulator [Streptomyces sp. XD-27]WKX71191.1 BTAD domain-containing putative transcriptional regulator [Streptomyces sp. XD-27]
MRYLILGPTEARAADGQPLPVGGARLRALLAALALRAARATPTPVDVLIDEVWGDEPPHDALAALQALVGRLRRALGRDAVLSAPGGYRLDATPDDIDLLRFERLVDVGGRALDAGDPETAAATLRTALGLWRGPALADLPDREAAAARPEALRLTALHQRVAADLARGQAVALVPELRELVADHPLDETFHAQLIQALRAIGRSADALAAYEDVRRGLADRLGTEPGPELQRLYRLLLDGGGPRTATATDAAAVTNAATATDRTAAPGHTATARPGPASAARLSPGSAARPGPASAARPARGNLRARLTSFVGRQAEIDALRDDLSSARLVTLTGPGGSGKTRLSEETAATLGAAHRDGVWAAELAPLDDPRAVPGTVLSALGRRETALLGSGLEGRTSGADAADPTARLIEYCGPRRLLLLLDNCEHVIDAAAQLAEALLAACPGVTILATSREPLGVPGETVRPVEPLLPAPAHQLFAERAAAVRPGFDPARDPATEAAVAEICRRLDGLPLAIELAAARLRLLTPRQIAGRLDDRFRLLTTGSRTVLPRQQTLRAVVDWSWDLLDDRERALLRRASVFAGGWTLDAAESVCADPVRQERLDAAQQERLDAAQQGGADPVRHGCADAPEPSVRIGQGDVLDLLGALADKSLLVVDHPQGRDDEVRFRMLETIHEYVNERAAETPATRRDHAAALRRHTAHFRAFAHTADPLVRSAEQLPWLRRVEADLDNIRAALHRAIECRDEDSAIALVFDMGWFWWLRNYRDEGASWAARALTLIAPVSDPVPSSRHEDVVDLRLLRYFLIAEQRSEQELRSPETMAAARAIRAAYAGHSGPRGARFPGLLWPFCGYLIDGHTSVVPMLDEAVANCRRYGDEWALGALLMLRTHLEIDLPGGMARAERGWPELRELSRRVGDRWILAQVEEANGEMAMAHGRYADARASHEEALRLAREIGAHTETPFLITRLADLAFQCGDLPEAVRLLDESEAEAERHGARDAQAFNRMLRASIALRGGDLDAARARCDEALREAARAATPPPQFWTVLGGIDARITADSGDAPGGLRKIRDALRTGIESHSTEGLLALQAETAAYILLQLARHAPAARLLGAAGAWRAGQPRTPSLEEHVTDVAKAACEALGEGAFEELRAEGTRLTADECVALLDSIATPPPPPSVTAD